MKNNLHSLNNVTNYILSKEFYFLVGFLCIGMIIFFLMRKVVNPFLIKVVCRKNKKWSPVFERNRAFLPFAYLVPVLFLMSASQYLPTTWIYVEKILSASMVALFTLLIASFLQTLNLIYETYPISQEKPMKSYAQLGIIVVYLFGGIVTICELLDKSPTVFLGGAVALMAGILLVFRDTLLSFIVSMQLASNKLIQKGDWIEVPAFGADGTVIDIALHVVKIQNFDKTIVTIPTYKIMESGFRNWRGMFESGGRQIKKSIRVDQNSVRFMTESDFNRLYKHPLVKKCLPSSQELSKMHHQADKEALTNLGVLRTYVSCYLKGHPKIHQDMSLMVRVLEPTPNGIPLQIYAYTNDTRWVYHEQIQADILEHVMALLEIFDLRVYQNLQDLDFQGLDNINQVMGGKFR